MWTTTRYGLSTLLAGAVVAGVAATACAQASELGEVEPTGVGGSGWLEFHARGTWARADRGLRWKPWFKDFLEVEAPSRLSPEGPGFAVEARWHIRTTEDERARFLLGASGGLFLLAEIGSADLSADERWSGPGYDFEQVRFRATQVWALAGAGFQSASENGLFTLDLHAAGGVLQVRARTDYEFVAGPFVLEAQASDTDTVAVAKVSVGVGVYLRRPPVLEGVRRPGRATPSLRLSLDLYAGDAVALTFDGDQIPFASYRPTAISLGLSLGIAL